MKFLLILLLAVALYSDTNTSQVKYSEVNDTISFQKDNILVAPKLVLNKVNDTSITSLENLSIFLRFLVLLVMVVGITMAIRTYKQNIIWRHEDNKIKASEFYLKEIISLIDNITDKIKETPTMTPKDIRLLASHLNDAWILSGAIDESIEPHINILNTRWNIITALIVQFINSSTQQNFTGDEKELSFDDFKEIFKDREINYINIPEKHKKFLINIGSNYVDKKSLEIIFYVTKNIPYGEIPNESLTIDMIAKENFGSWFGGFYLATMVTTGFWEENKRVEYSKAISEIINSAQPDSEE